MAEIAIVIALGVLGLAVWLVLRTHRSLEDKHRQMLVDLHGGLAQQSDRLAGRPSDELNRTRDTLPRVALGSGGGPGGSGPRCLPTRW